MRAIACEACPARSAGLVCDVSADVLGELRASGSVTLYRPRQVIFAEGTPSDALYLVCHGLVKLYQSDRFGRDHILQVAGPGALLGELSLDDADVMSASAEAMSEAQVSRLSRERLGAFVQRHPETAVRLLAALSRELAVARRKARDLALKGAERRLAALLLRLQGDDGPSPVGPRVDVRYSRRDLAEMVGVSPETASRLLAALKRKGAIATAGREIVIADAERLVRIAQHGEMQNGVNGR